MNTTDLACFDDIDEQDLEQMVARFVRVFHRLPSSAELTRFRRARSMLAMRLPAKGRRRLATLIATL